MHKRAVCCADCYMLKTSEKLLTISSSGNNSLTQYTSAPSKLTFRSKIFIFSIRCTPRKQLFECDANSVHVTGSCGTAKFVQSNSWTVQVNRL